MNKYEAKLRDKSWRMAHLYLIKNEDGEIVPFVPRPEQLEFRENRHNRNFILKARKLGMSTDIVIDYLDECLFTPNTHAAHIDKSKEDAFGKLAMARLAWEQGPNHPDPAIALIWKGIHAKLAIKSDAKGVLEWANGSKQEAGVSFRGGTPQRLHISELGYIAVHHQDKAKEIKAGALNAVPPGGIATIETTFEGGPFGVCYDIAKLAMDKLSADDLERTDWKFHFFPWYEHPSYVAKPKPMGQLHSRTVDYFKMLERDHGLRFPPERVAWWDNKSREQGDDMVMEFPTLPHEPFDKPAAGAIYPVMRKLRASGRIGDWEIEQVPIVTGWDLGVSDSLVGWAVQIMPREIIWLAWWEGTGYGAAQVAQVIAEWEALFERPISVHLLPHDADIRDKGSGKTYSQQVIAAGVPSNRVRVVPRTPDVWVGINEVRKVLEKSWFHQRCDEPRIVDGEQMPSGVVCLENYRRRQPTSTGVISEVPLHDATSHTADAARTIAEGISHGLHVPSEARRGGVRVITGVMG